MLYTKVNPVGVDIPIQQLQIDLHDQLNSIWGLSPNDYQAYGRCYRNQKDSDYVAEVYKGGNEYQEVSLDDRFAAISFFGLNSDIRVNLVNEAKIHLIYWVNVRRLKPLIGHRGDEEIRKDVELLVKAKPLGFILTGIRLNVDRVLQEYRTDQVKFRDMQPFHCFRFDFDLKYDINIC